MNVNGLLEHWNEATEAPDAIGSIRKLIIQLAVRGELVAQDPTDEVCEILRSKMVGTKLDQTGLPKQWVRARLNTVLDFKYGKGLESSARKTQGDVPVFGSNGIVAYTDKALTSLPTVIIGRKGSAGSVNIAEKPCWVMDVAYYVEPPSYITLHYLAIALEALALPTLAKGVKPGLSRSDAYALSIDIPPRAEQCRIVATVNEMMALLDEWERALIERESNRNLLAKSVHSRLVEPAPETFHEDVRFALDVLPRLTARTDQIKQLRHTILSLAMRGSLAPQNPEDEHAEHLLKRIASSKRRAGKESASTKSETDWPYKLPPGWTWTRLEDVCSKTGSGSTPAGGKAAYKPTGIPFLRSQNVYNDGLRLSDVAYIDAHIHQRMGATKVRSGDLLLNITGGSIGRCCRVRSDLGEANVSQHVAIIRPALPELAAYLHYLILSPLFQSFIYDEQTGAGRGGLPKNRMDRIPVPLPPLPEQERIVDEIEVLMALCDQLECNLLDSLETGSRLLSVLVEVDPGSQSKDA